jgi:large subunit ribosomal protein L25
MQTFEIAVQPRKKEEKLRALKTRKQTPGVIYGGKFKNTVITINSKELRDLFHGAGHANLVDVKIEGEEKPVKAIIHDLQFNPVTDEITHIDFYAIDMNKKITTTVPLRFVGESEAIKTLGGMLITTKTELEIRCLPGDLIPFIEADISKLVELNDAIKVKDLNVPGSIEILAGEEATIAHAEEPRVQVIEEEVTPAEGEEAEGEEGAEGEEKEGEEGEKKEEAKEGEKEEKKEE